MDNRAEQPHASTQLWKVALRKLQMLGSAAALLALSRRMETLTKSKSPTIIDFGTGFCLRERI
jgi:hypothetical protein